MKKLLIGLPFLLSACGESCICDGIYASPKLLVPPHLSQRPTKEEIAAEQEEAKVAAERAAAEKAAAKTPAKGS